MVVLRFDRFSWYRRRYSLLLFYAKVMCSDTSGLSFLSWGVGMHSQELRFESQKIPIFLFLFFPSCFQLILRTCSPDTQPRSQHRSPRPFSRYSPALV